VALLIAVIAAEATGAAAAALSKSGRTQTQDPAAEQRSRSDGAEPTDSPAYFDCSRARLTTPPLSVAREDISLAARAGDGHVYRWWSVGKMLTTGIHRWPTRQG
jgi:hypothetical protein